MERTAYDVSNRNSLSTASVTYCRRFTALRTRTQNVHRWYSALVVCLVICHYNYTTVLTAINLYVFVYTSFFFSYACHELLLVSQETVSSSAECSRDKPPFSVVRGQDLTMCDIILVSLQGQGLVSASCHFLLQAAQCPCSVYLYRNASCNTFRQSESPPTAPPFSCLWCSP